MFVLNFYGNIAPICISEKLGLFISNLPNEEHNELRDMLVDELELAIKADKIYQEKLGTECPCDIERLYHTLFPEEPHVTVWKKTHLERIASQMICVYQDYSYDDIPLGG